MEVSRLVIATVGSVLLIASSYVPFAVADAVDGCESTGASLIGNPPIWQLGCTTAQCLVPLTCNQKPDMDELENLIWICKCDPAPGGAPECCETALRNVGTPENPDLRPRKIGECSTECGDPGEKTKCKLKWYPESNPTHVFTVCER